MAKEQEQQFYVLMSSGEKFLISELDFNNLKGRIARGQTNGWYMQRGPSMGDRHEWQVQFKDVAGFWSDRPAKGDKPKAAGTIDVAKRLPPEVGKKEPEPVAECLHDWNRPETYTYVTEIVNGVNRYYKQCPECECKSQLIKKREVELIMEAQGKTIDDVTLLTGK